jgi:hypothetical protein
MAIEKIPRRRTRKKPFDFDDVDSGFSKKQVDWEIEQRKRKRKAFSKRRVKTKRKRFPKD